MTRIKVALVFGNTPNFDANAFKYFILSVNKVQSIYEFLFPDLDCFLFKDEICRFETANKILEKFISENEIIADHAIAIISTSFDNNYYSNAETDTSVLTSDTWEKYFSPPSLFEHLLHSMVSCLIYSQKLPQDRNITDKMRAVEIGSHKDTRGCIADFTRQKIDDKAGILLGYICEEHQKEITLFYGEDYLKQMQSVLDRKWIGSIDEKGSVAYNLKHAYNFNINRDSGFNKTFWEKSQDKFYEIPGDVIGEVLKVILTAVITYLLIKYGIMSKS